MTPRQRAELCVASMVHDAFYRDLDSLDREVLIQYIERAIEDDRGTAGCKEDITSKPWSKEKDVLTAHSKSEYRRLTAQGANVVPPKDT